MADGLAPSFVAVKKPLPPLDVSAYPAELLNHALALSLEWGQDWQAPIQPRLCRAYPTLSAAATDLLHAWTREVQAYAFKLVADDYPLVLAGQVSTAPERVQQRYPQVSAGNLARLYNQGMYYAWHG